MGNSSNTVKKRKTHPEPPADAPTAADETPIEIVVRRGALRRYDQLKRKSDGLPVKLIWDRRGVDRNKPTEHPGPERREGAQFTWDVADFAVVGRDQRTGRAKTKRR